MTVRFLDTPDHGVIVETDPADDRRDHWDFLLERYGLQQDPTRRSRWTFPAWMPRDHQHKLAGPLASTIAEAGDEVVLDLDLGHPVEPARPSAFEAAPSATRVQVTQGVTGAVHADHDGPDAGLARAVLISCGFRPAGQAVRLIRVDGEEEHYAAKAVRALREAGFTVTAEPHLDPEQDFSEDDQQWADYPMPWLSREEVLKVSAKAQEIFEDIRSGRLLVHAHAFDGDTPVAVATYVGGDTVVLHGSDHLRQEIDRNSDPLPALAAFAQHYGATLRPGPAPHTMTEHLVCLDQTARLADQATPQPSSNHVAPTRTTPGERRPGR
ncbi:hypothetical protein [Streptacidiphilus fuscans]|uniref:Uncharacterized protein n=1 Tax=Streptacidiphilus fuscans TaxID=2789292 RepID=A0A931B7R2_9ACTN|nr:hypothetical protein [Streptacidiphilus fuscans]MBF9071758.1 hypothetical protein [Streptacidiphilus fuscans]